MTKVVHTIDPNYDTVILLTKPTASFAAWHDAGDEVLEGFLRKSIGRKKMSKKEKKASKSNRGSHRFSQPDNSRSPLQATNGLEGLPGTALERGQYVASVSAGPSSHFPDLDPVPSTSTTNLCVSLFGEGTPEPSNDISSYRTTSPRHEDTTTIATSDPMVLADSSLSKHEKVCMDENTVHYQVSSRHLMLASSTFRNMMSGKKYSEGFQQHDGLFYTYPEGWDPNAFLILMHIMHGLNLKAPQEVSLEVLTKIAILVDFYDCAETVEMFKSGWISGVKKTTPIPDTYCRDLILWICAAQILDLRAEFEQATLAALKQSDEMIRTLDLPIRPIIIRKSNHEERSHSVVLNMKGDIDDKRCQAIEDIITNVYSLIDIYRNPDYICPQDSNDSFACGSFLLGALMRGLESHHLIVRPKVPFRGFSFDGLCNNIRAFQSPVWYMNDRYSYRPAHNSQSGNCHLAKVLQDLIEGVSVGICGLDLANYGAEKL